MEKAIEARIAQIIRRRQRADAAVDPAVEPHESDRQLAHDRVLAELPRFLTKISSAVLELNDRIADAHIGVVLKALEHSPSAEAIYVLSVAPAHGNAPELFLNIDFTGKLNAVLHVRGARSLVKVTSIFSIDTLEAMDVLLSLLEAQPD